MAEQNALKVLGKLDDDSKNVVAQQIIRALGDKLPKVYGEIYLGYPIYIDEIDNRRVCVDMALITKIGVYIINILTAPVTDYGEIQDDIYAKVESKFKQQPFLFKRKHLIFDFFTVTYTTVDLSEIEDYPLVSSVDALNRRSRRQRTGVQ